MDHVQIIVTFVIIIIVIIIVVIHLFTNNLMVYASPCPNYGYLFIICLVYGIKKKFKWAYIVCVMLSN